MKDSLLTTSRLLTDIDRVIRNLPLGTGYRQELLGLRNTLRTRADHLETRLRTADTKFPHTPETRIAPEHEDLYLTLLHEYESAHDGSDRANAHLEG